VYRQPGEVCLLRLGSPLCQGASPQPYLPPRSFLLLVPAVSARQHQVDSYCSLSGDYCTGVLRAGGRIKLLIRTFSFLGPYILCVRPPGSLANATLIRSPN
jgi:hypothetical protein